MIVHKERSLTENLLAFSGTFERHKDLGLTASPEATAEMLRMLQLMAAQAQRAENSVRELTRELVEEASLDLSPGHVRLSNLTGTPSQRIEWIAIETARCASKVARSEAADSFELTSCLRYLGSELMATAQGLQGAELAITRAPGGVVGWVRGVIEGGRS